MLKELISNIQKGMMDTYPQLETPAAMRAVITSASQTAETYARRVKITDHTTGESHECTIEEPYYVYTVHPADNNGKKSDKHPAIPGVKSKDCYSAGSTVVVVFTGGEICPAIVGG